MELKSGDQSINIGDFEILDHPVTNAEYRQFTDATGYRKPLHWYNGKIPGGKEDYPVIYINREDLTAYTDWLTQTTGRIHRSPTRHEFELAACGGDNSTRFFWGNEDSELSSETVNYNDSRNRIYDRWEDYLKPADWGFRNKIGLYQMSGNVWQFLQSNEDPATTQWKYRIEALHDLEYEVIGGSWASIKEYCGQPSRAEPGARLPDLGIRLVREPEGAGWSMLNRRVVAVPHPNGGVGISWALLTSDSGDTRFNIYRLEEQDREHNDVKLMYRDHNGIKINTEPIYQTSFLDTQNLVHKKRYYYRVITVDENGKESHPSDWAAITIGEDQYPVVVKFKPLFEKGGMVPVFGDLEGYGKPGCVIRLDNGNSEGSQDPGKPVQLEAFSCTGRSLWRKDIAWHGNIYGSASHAVFNVWDMDGDGKDEVITLLQIGEDNYLAILDGMSGKVLKKTLWDKMETDFSKSSTRIQMSIAYLDGKTPAVITQTGLYENGIISAYDNNLKKLWTYNCFMATNGSGGHKIEIADVDGDGKQEIIFGTACLNHDGTLRWALYLQHPDIISIHDYIPDRPGLEICFIVESPMHAGIYMVDANTGEIIWKNNREEDPAWSHGHVGWTADIWDGSPGMECMTNREGHNDRTYLLFSSDGRKLSDEFPVGFVPMEWDGDPTRELLGNNGKVIGKYNGKEIVIMEGVIPNPVPNSHLVSNFVADLCGDFRSEMVISATDTDGRKAIMVITAPDPVGSRYVTPRDDLEYQLWLARNMGGGYSSVFEYILHEK